MSKRVYGFVFARGGSKGVPRKNVRLLAGRPLIAHAIEAARRSRWLERVLVSTDDAELAAVARQFGAEVPFMRPAELARDDSPEWMAWRHALNFLAEQEGAMPDVFVSVPTTAPLREPADIDACVDEFLKGEADIVITIRRAARSPYFNMVRLDEGGGAHLVIAPPAEVNQRHAAPRVYDMTTVAYVTSPGYVLRAAGCFAGRTRAVEIPEERAVDIDTEYDFRIAEFLMQARQSREID